MKKIIVCLLFFLLLIQISKAQSFVHFPDSASWYVRYHYGHPPYHYINYQLAGDTVIGAYTYKKLMNDTVLSAVIREDTVLNKVFAKVFQISFYNAVNCATQPLFCMCADSLLFDYNLLPGDTFVGIFNAIGYNNCTYKVGCRDSVYFGNMWRKRWYLTLLSSSIWSPPCGPSSDGFGIIEGVGSSSGLLEAFGLGINGEQSQLLCFGTSSQTIYLDTGYVLNCQQPLTNDEVVFNNIIMDLYPNPSDGIINLKTSGNKKIIQVEINDLCGRIIYQENKKDGINRINNSNLKSGIYFVKAETSVKEDIIKKIIIQK